MTRNSIPIEQHSLAKGVHTGIDFSLEYAYVDAAVQIGASLEDLYKWMLGGYPSWFVAKVLAYQQMSTLISNHVEDAKIKAANKK